MSIDRKLIGAGSAIIISTGAFIGSLIHTKKIKSALNLFDSRYMEWKYTLDILYKEAQFSESIQIEINYKMEALDTFRELAFNHASIKDIHAYIDACNELVKEAQDSLLAVMEEDFNKDR